MQGSTAVSVALGLMAAKKAEQPLAAGALIGYGVIVALCKSWQAAKKMAGLVLSSGKRNRS